MTHDCQRSSSLAGPIKVFVMPCCMVQGLTSAYANARKNGCEAPVL